MRSHYRNEMYNKLFTKILDSSIWLENQPTRLVWITFLACMDQDGTVALSSVGNVANRARVSEKEAEEAIQCLESPDAHNPDQEQQGRRIERIPGVGWLVLNAAKYRDIIKAEESRAANRERVRRHRQKAQNEDCNAGVMDSNDLVMQSEADQKQIKSEDIQKSKKKGTRIDADFTVTKEMTAWFIEKGFTFKAEIETEKFINHWTGKSGQTAVKLDWQAAWRNWMLNAQEYKGGFPAVKAPSPEDQLEAARRAEIKKARDLYRPTRG